MHKNTFVNEFDLIIICFRNNAMLLFNNIYYINLQNLIISLNIFNGLITKITKKKRKKETRENIYISKYIHPTMKVYSLGYETLYKRYGLKS